MGRSEHNFCKVSPGAPGKRQREGNRVWERGNREVGRGKGDRRLADHRAEVHKDGQWVKREWSIVWAGQSTTFVRCPLEPLESVGEREMGYGKGETGRLGGGKGILNGSLKTQE